MMKNGKLELKDYKQIIEKAGKEYGIGIYEYFMTNYRAHSDKNPEFLLNVQNLMWDLRKLVREGKAAGVITMSKLAELEPHFLRFVEKIADEQRLENKVLKQVKHNGTTPGNASNRLNFICSNKQIYDVFRMLKKKGWIEGTQDEIANFILNNINFKNGSKPTLATIRAEISRIDGRPSKEKRFELPTD